MNLKTLLALVGICITFIACDKSKDEQPGEQPYLTPKLSKIAFYQNDSLTGETTFEYDVQGRLSKTSYNGNDYTTYRYEPGYIIRKSSLSNNDEPPLTDTLQLNSAGLVIFDPRDNATYEYTYEGYLHQLIADYGTFTYKISYGNTILMNERAMMYEIIRFKNEYTFLPDKLNTVGNENMGIAFFGKQDKNLVSEAKQTYVEYGGNYEKITNYHYEFNEKSRVKKQLGPKGSYWLYTYMN